MDSTSICERSFLTGLPDSLKMISLKYSNHVALTTKTPDPQDGQP